MNIEKPTIKSSSRIKRRGFYGALSGALAGVYSAITFGFGGTSSKSSKVQVSLHPQAVCREKRG